MQRIATDTNDKDLPHWGIRVRDRRSYPNNLLLDE
jgi:hypothetical protein